MTKHFAAVLLADRQPVSLLPGVFELRYTENHDIAFSLLHWFEHEQKPLLLGLFALAGLAFTLFIWWHRRRASALEQAGYALVLSGALGNIVDRFMRGYVIDFLHINYWPVFNVADVAIVVGGGFILLSSTLDARKHPAPLS